MSAIFPFSDTKQIVFEKNKNNILSNAFDDIIRLFNKKNYSDANYCLMNLQHIIEAHMTKDYKKLYIAYLCNATFCCNVIPSGGHYFHYMDNQYLVAIMLNENHKIVEMLEEANNTYDINYKLSCLIEIIKHNSMQANKYDDEYDDNDIAELKDYIEIMDRCINADFPLIYITHDELPNKIIMYSQKFATEESTKNMARILVEYAKWIENIDNSESCKDLQTIVNKFTREHIKNL